MRNFLQSNHQLLTRLEALEHQVRTINDDVKMHDGEIETMFKVVKELIDSQVKQVKQREPIGFKTQSNSKKDK
jgi:uncharacterized protein YoxC